MMPTTTTNRNVAIGAGAALLLAAGVGAVFLFTGDDQAQQTVPTSPAATAGEFAAAYAGGDTETACGLTTGKALEAMQADGLCGRAGGWNVTYSLEQQCEVPTRGAGFVFATSQEIGRFLGFEVIVTGTPDTGYYVTELHHGGSRSYCDIYGGGGG